jgi:hypothetical protein
MNDRIRAQPPATDIDSWTKAVVLNIHRGEGELEITVLPTESDHSETAVISVTPAVFDLFTGRLEPPVDGFAEVLDATVWVK